MPGYVTEEAPRSCEHGHQFAVGQQALGRPPCLLSRGWGMDGRGAAAEALGMRGAEPGGGVRAGVLAGVYAVAAGNLLPLRPALLSCATSVCVLKRPAGGPDPFPNTPPSCSGSLPVAAPVQRDPCGG
jgi:hypothetical protein